MDGDAELTEAERVTVATYDANAERWCAGRDADFWAAERELFRRLVPRGRVLDIGSGSGRDARLLNAAGYEVVGVDVSASLLRVAAASCPEAEFRLASMYELPFGDGSFDGVWMAASLLHAPKSRAGRALGEVRRVLRPGGAAFIAVKRGDGEGLETSGIGERYFAYYRPDELRALLERCGLPVAELSERAAGATTWVCAWSAKR